MGGEGTSRGHRHRRNRTVDVVGCVRCVNVLHKLRSRLESLAVKVVVHLRSGEGAEAQGWTMARASSCGGPIDRVLHKRRRLIPPSGPSGWGGLTSFSMACGASIVLYSGWASSSYVSCSVAMGMLARGRMDGWPPGSGGGPPADGWPSGRGGGTPWPGAPMSKYTARRGEVR